MTEIAGAAAAADVLTGSGHTRIDAAEARHECANCGTHLQGAYCHACGQKGHLHNKLWHLAHELVEGIAHFDGRLWRTLPLLAFRPGRLSREWIEGRRARYVSPLHVFLFAIFLLFIIPTFTGRHLLGMPTPSAGGEVTAGVARDAVDLSLPDADVAGTPFEKINEQWKKAKANPEYYGYKVETLAYKLSFVVVPISMAILWLLLLFKRGYSLYDHGVVALYGVGFLTLLAALANAIPQPVGGALAGLAFFWAPVHAIIHLHGAYRLSWFGAVLRGLLLALFSLIGFSFFLLGVYALGVFS